MIQVVGYSDCVPPRNKNLQKAQILPTVIEGVRRAGDHGELISGLGIRDCDVAVLQGWVHEGSAHSRHLNLRRAVIEHQQRISRRTLVADSNLFLYVNPANPHNYLRYSFDGVFPNTGNYFADHVDPMRWAQIAQDHAITVKPWRTKGRHILVCGQRDGGWSMGSIKVVDWLAQIIVRIRQYSDRPIVIRPHPGDKNAHRYIGEFNQAGVLSGVTISNTGHSLIHDLDRCWAVVNHNSSPAVGAIIEGIPVFLTDPERSQCREVANCDFSRIENPDMPDRQAWLEKIAMSHWSFQDWETGRAWAHIQKFV